ncbi:hypothetical protein V6N13_120209 [Hibiscus sabdariffa]|uniref:Uncharacterized protein n=1 Tax=Hibiscus sabdariffa TaxID=183260 RepID=A0ABR2E3K2_9ROSI
MRKLPINIILEKSKNPTLLFQFAITAEDLGDANANPRQCIGVALKGILAVTNNHHLISTAHPLRHSSSPPFISAPATASKVGLELELDL